MLLAALALMACSAGARAEDGYNLWLRYAPLDPVLAADYATQLGEVVAPAQTPTLRAARDELVRGLTGLLGTAPRIQNESSAGHVLALGTPQSSALIAPFREEVESLGEAGYLL